jgi:hypothetical protein
MRSVWLALALLPYGVLAGYDTWMHERARRVPRIEQVLHLGLGISLIAFLVGAFRGNTPLALGALVPFLGLLVWDAFGYHAVLEARERRVHAWSYLAFGLFVSVWAWIERAP